LIDFFVFNATFSNISAISWTQVLEVEEAGISGENHRQMGKNLVNLITSGCESSAHFFCNLQSRAQTHAVLVIGLYELLGNIRVFNKWNIKRYGCQASHAII
jgi:protein gp37